MVASQAAAKAKNMINDVHIYDSLDELGLGHLAPHPNADDGHQISSAARGSAKRAKGKRKITNPSGLTEEELLRMQQELFASARQQYQPPTPTPTPTQQQPPS